MYDFFAILNFDSVIYSLFESISFLRELFTYSLKRKLLWISYWSSRIVARHYIQALFRHKLENTTELLPSSFSSKQHFGRLSGKGCSRIST